MYLPHCLVCSLLHEEITIPLIFYCVEEKEKTAPHNAVLSVAFMNPNRPPNCRIFLGNLASEKTSRKELQEIFSKYGEIVEEIVLRRSFGFIQYDNPGKPWLISSI